MAAKKKDSEPFEPTVKASRVEARRVRWLWRNRIPQGMITIIAGKPDQGKGLFACHVAADVSHKGGKVLFSASEDDVEQMTAPRLQAAGANLDNIEIYPDGFVFGPEAKLPEQMAEFEKRIVDGKIKLVVIDPFNDHLAGISRFSDNVRRVTQPLKQIARRTGCAIVVVEHALKRVPKKSHPLGAIGGSGSGLPAASRAAYIFGKDPKDPDRRLLVKAKLNIAELAANAAIEFELDTEEVDVVGDMPCLIAGGETEYDPMDLLTTDEDEGNRGPKPDKRAEAAQWLIEYLTAAGGPVPAGQLKEDAKLVGHISRNTLRRAADEDVKVVKNPPGGGPKCTWDLPQELKDLLAGGGAK